MRGNGGRKLQFVSVLGSNGMWWQGGFGKGMHVNLKETWILSEFSKLPHKVQSKVVRLQLDCWEGYKQIMNPVLCLDTSTCMQSNIATSNASGSDKLWVTVFFTAKGSFLLVISGVLRIRNNYNYIFFSILTNIFMKKKQAMG